MAPLHLLSWSKRAEGCQPCRLLHPEEGPSHTGNLKTCSLLSPEEAAQWAHQRPPPFQVAASSLPSRQWAWVLYGMPASSNKPQHGAPTLCYFSSEHAYPGEIGMERGKARQRGDKHHCLLGGLGNLGTCPLPGSVSSPVKWEFWQPPYEGQEGLTLGTT